MPSNILKMNLPVNIFHYNRKLELDLLEETMKFSHLAGQLNSLCGGTLSPWVPPVWGLGSFPGHGITGPPGGKLKLLTCLQERRGQVTCEAKAVLSEDFSAQSSKRADYSFWPMWLPDDGAFLSTKLEIRWRSASDSVHSALIIINKSQKGNNDVGTLCNK